MAELRVNPTKMELKKLQLRYNTARRGHKLLKDKRDELMRQFIEVVREYKLLRTRVEEAFGGVYESFSAAEALTGSKMLQEALILPKKEGTLHVDYRDIMSVTVPVFNFDLMGENGAESYNYGFAFTSGELDSSLAKLSGVLKDMVMLAQYEKTAQMLAEEIERTRRRVNALEYIMMPRYLEAIRRIKTKLEENERGNITRLMKVKDIMLEKRYGQNDAEQ